ncbi:hypothetical protein DAVIS_04420 [Mycobacterium marinum]|uniref:Uncharacterized protein n=1 Tax=Mycobacterium marinum TaxID=1781 RepID=A0A3E2MQW4_MYCMR|nr:hypothetical protein DAVIS_04420 [Mycobacterium marinum]
MDLIEQQPVTELGIVAVGVEDRVGQIRLVVFGIGDRTRQPGVVVLTMELQYPTRDRHRHPDRGVDGRQLLYERVEPVLTMELQYPTRDRHRHPDRGVDGRQLLYERVEL